MYLWGRSNSTSCLLITELCQGCKDDQFQKKLNEAVEEQRGHAVLALNKDARFSLLIRLRKLCTECCRQVVVLVSAATVHLEGSL